MKIQFKGKIREMSNVDGSLAYRYIDVPEFKRAHVDMNAARRHPKYGSWANSDLFPGMLRRIRRDIFGGTMLRLDSVPEGVVIDESTFLATVTVSV